MDKYEYIRKFLEENKNDESAIKMKEYMRNKFEFYGIPSSDRKNLYKDFLKNEKKLKQVDWYFLDKCYEDKHREFQYLVSDYLFTMNKYLEYDDIFKIERYIRKKQWWDTIDFLDKVIGLISLKDNRVDELMLEWSLDSNIWVKRVAIDHQLCKKDKTNTKLLEKIILNNLGSEEFFINKAIGWSLREYSKYNPLWVQDFINNYGNKMSKLSIKEASKYI